MVEERLMKTNCQKPAVPSHGGEQAIVTKDHTLIFDQSERDATPTVTCRSIRIDIVIT